MSLKSPYVQKKIGERASHCATGAQIETVEFTKMKLGLTNEGIHKKNWLDVNSSRNSESCWKMDKYQSLIALTGHVIPRSATAISANQWSLYPGREGCQ